MPLHQKVAHFGRLNSLAQTLLKLTVPGVPDIYQGNELWDLSLVDPDNRRPVDFELRQARLQQVLEQSEPLVDGQITQAMLDGTLKLLVTAYSLRYRRDNAALFQQGNYCPITVQGKWRDHVCAFLRQTDGKSLLVVVPLRCVALTNGSLTLPVGQESWEDTALVLPEGLDGTFEDIFTKQHHSMTKLLAVSDIFNQLPVALLTTSAKQ